jgi:hypothetical protein
MPEAPKENQNWLKVFEKACLAKYSTRENVFNSIVQKLAKRTSKEVTKITKIIRNQRSLLQVSKENQDWLKENPKMCFFENLSKYFAICSSTE